MCTFSTSSLEKQILFYNFNFAFFYGELIFLFGFEFIFPNKLKFYLHVSESGDSQKIKYDIFFLFIVLLYLWDYSYFEVNNMYHFYLYLSNRVKTTNGWFKLWWKKGIKCIDKINLWQWWWWFQPMTLWLMDG